MEKENVPVKFAVAVDGNRVSGHTGHCEEFAVFTAEGGKITAKEMMENPGHKPGFLPNFLNDRGVNAILPGAWGPAPIGF